MTRRQTKTAHTVSKNASAEEFRNKIKLKNFEARNYLTKKHPHVEAILKDKNFDPAKLRQHSAKIIGAGMVAGSLLVASPNIAQNLPTPDDLLHKSKHSVENQDSNKQIVVNSLKSILPAKTRPLERNEEKILEQIFQSTMGINAKATLESEHLNTTYGRIGAEQHLRRYPGDTVDQHGIGDEIAEGIAPGLGAWGYLANSEEQMTDHLLNVEKWYAVVQTMYLPDWNTRQPHLKNWYKHRKVLIVNTQNGNAVIAAVADAGPAAWTGKHYGGSPEVMEHLGGEKYKKGPVVMFFVDDPDNVVPLGPVKY